LKIIQKNPTILSFQSIVGLLHQLGIRIVWFVNKLIDDSGLRGILIDMAIWIEIIGNILPLLESVSAFYHLLLKHFVADLVIAQVLCFIFFIDESVIRFVLILLVIDGLIVAIFCVSFLQVKLFF